MSGDASCFDILSLLEWEGLESSSNAPCGVNQVTFICKVDSEFLEFKDIEIFIREKLLDSNSSGLLIFMDCIIELVTIYMF